MPPQAVLHPEGDPLSSKDAVKPGTTWNLDNPSTLVKARLGYSKLSDARREEVDETLWRIDEALYSTRSRVEYAIYHHFEADRLQRLRKRRIQRSASPEKTKMMYQVEHPEDRIASEANIVACLQNAHAVFDLFMFGAYYALFVGRSAPLLEPRGVTWRNVEPLLSKQPKLATLRSQMKGLRANADFKYLDALVNSSKHRAVIKTKHYIVIDYAIDEESAPRFDEFEFNGQRHARREALPFTRSVCNLMGKFTVEAGQELDVALSAL